MEHIQQQGLTEQEAQTRLHHYGHNQIKVNEISSIQSLIATQLFTVINFILLIAGVFSLIIHNVADGIFILAIIVINAIFGFAQEYRAQQSLEKLKQLAAPTARVIRDGQQKQIPADEIVPGDILILSEGSRVAADGIFLEATHLEIDESMLTGESLAVIKKTKEQVFLGTLVSKGRGVVLVEKTGKNTRFGQIAQSLAVIQPETPPLQKSLASLGKLLSIFALGLGFITIPIGFLHGESLFPVLLVGVSIGIAAIPEGLPAVVTMAFAIGTHRMAKQGAIVRKMIAIETLGSVQVVLVDKTGTITENSMRVKRHWLTHEKWLPNLLNACVLGNTASLAPERGNKFKVIGDPTDGALLLWAKEQNHTLPPGEQVLDEYVFDSEAKTITTVWQKDGKKHVFVRGAPEILLEKCELPKKERETISEHIESYAEDGLRVIGFGYKTERHLGKMSRSHLEQSLTFLGLVGMYDPPREEVKVAIAKCRRAGIHVIMVTGDNEITALALAKEIGLIEKDDELVITGEMLRNMTDDKLAEVILKTRVFARTQPEEKLRLVDLLKKQKLVVGVTGDGVNDALALKKADVGVAMGERGTDVAKEAADIVLTDDNFASLVKTIEEGRLIYKNIMNAILYLLSGNLAEISLVVFASLIHLPIPLLPTQILWINLVTDSLPALALATGSKDNSVLSEKPRNATTPILTFNRILLICAIGLSLAEMLLMLFSYLVRVTDQPFAQTIIFDLLIYSQLVIAMFLGWHSLKRGNLFLLVTVIFIAIIQTVITFTPFLQLIFHLEI